MDSQQQQFCLKWNSFGSNLATAFGNLFKSESLTDVTLFCEGVSLKAHKVILAACSKHFQDLFEVAPPCPGTVVILDGTSASNMAALLEFMYKGEVHVSQDCLSSFLKAAECLQVKGLSIEHEKFAESSQHSPSSSGREYHHSHNLLDGRSGSPSSLCSETHSPPRKQLKLNNTNHSIPSPSTDPTDLTSPTTPTTSSTGQFNNSVIAPYMPPYHRPYERSNSTSSAVVAMPPFDRKRHRRSLTETESINGSTSSSASSNCLQDSNSRPSVLRDGKGASTALSPTDLTANYRLSEGQNDRFSSDSGEQGERCSSGGVVNNNSPFDRPPLSVGSGNGDSDLVNCKEEPRQQSSNNSQGNFDPGPVCPEVNVRRRGRPPSTSLVPTDLSIKMEPIHATGLRNNDISAAAYKELKQQVAAAAVDKDIAATLWPSATKQPGTHKTGSIGIADGKKMKCPYCERLYGYETNLRAHIRQRHQGIRVPCPFCARTFTRNNTVRRHIAREHKAELNMKSTIANAAAVAASAAPSCYPLPSHSQ